MNIDDIKNTLSEYFNEDDSRLGIAVIAENSDNDSKTVSTSLCGNPIEVEAVLAYIMHTDEDFYRIVKNALRTVDKIKKQDAKESHNS